MKKTIYALASIAAVTLLAACAGGPSEPTKEQVAEVLKSSFSERGIAKLDRLNQSRLQEACSDAALAGKPLDDKTRATIEKAIQDSIPYPKDGKYLGDWKEGEKIAQNGRGLQFSDAANTVNGGNCYACHQLSPKELSFGNFGPSLYKYGVTRGVKDPSAKESEAIVKYTWAKIWNTHAFNACSHMPRFGDAGILTEQQVKDVMALLLDPNSHVNH
jgi:L-cysteine S-thiosulfotransferase